MTDLSPDAARKLADLSIDRARLVKLLLERSHSQVRRRPCSNGVASARRGDRVPTSWAQQRLWFIDQLEAGNAGYQVSVAVRLRGTLDLRSLRRALDVLVQRHEVLRTTFVSVAGAPMQEIALDGYFPLQVINLSGYGPGERESQVRRHKSEEAHATFDLRRGPLIRGRLLQLRPVEQVLLVTMHHIVSDGWSRGVFVRELTELYRAHRGKSPQRTRALVHSIR